MPCTSIETGEKNIKGKPHILIKPLLEIGAPPVVVQKEGKAPAEIRKAVIRLIQLFPSEGNKRGIEGINPDAAVSGIIGK